MGENVFNVQSVHSGTDHNQYAWLSKQNSYGRRGAEEPLWPADQPELRRWQNQNIVYFLSSPAPSTFSSASRAFNLTLESEQYWKIKGELCKKLNMVILCLILNSTKTDL